MSPRFCRTARRTGGCASSPSPSPRISSLSRAGRFSADTGVTRESLDNWDGFFDAAAAYYDWSGGKPFCSLDYPLRAVELAALEAGAGDLFAENGFYNFSDPIFKATFLRFAEALARGHIVLSDLYSNTQVMTARFCPASAPPPPSCTTTTP